MSLSVNVWPVGRGALTSMPSVKMFGHAYTHIPPDATHKGASRNAKPEWGSYYFFESLCVHLFQYFEHILLKPKTSAFFMPVQLMSLSNGLVNGFRELLSTELKMYQLILFFCCLYIKYLWDSLVSEQTGKEFFFLNSGFEGKGISAFFKEKNHIFGEMAQLLEGLLCKHRDLSPYPQCLYKKYGSSNKNLQSQNWRGQDKSIPWSSLGS